MISHFTRNRVPEIKSRNKEIKSLLASEVHSRSMKSTSLRLYSGQDDSRLCTYRRCDSDILSACTHTCLSSTEKRAHTACRLASTPRQPWCFAKSDHPYIGCPLVLPRLEDKPALPLRSLRQLASTF